MSTSAPRDAATVILLRERATAATPSETHAPADEADYEVLLLQRPASQKFMGGAWVFPGGKVDPKDGEGLDAIRRAAVRELQEEAGVAVRPDDLVAWARWVTPAEEPVRFDARFFLALLPAAAEVIPDPHEVVDVVWLTPAEALGRSATGSLRIMPPTLRNLELLRAHVRHGDAFAAARAHEPVVVMPRAQVLDGVFTIVLPGDPLHDDAELRVPGPTRIVLRDRGFVSEDPP